MRCELQGRPFCAIWHDGNPSLRHAPTHHPVEFVRQNLPHACVADFALRETGLRQMNVLVGHAMSNQPIQECLLFGGKFGGGKFGGAWTVFGHEACHACVRVMLSCRYNARARRVIR